MIVITTTAFTLEFIVSNMDGMGGRTPNYLIKIFERQNETSALIYSFFPQKFKQ